MLCHRATSACCLHAQLAPPYADSTQLEISAFVESGEVSSTTPFAKYTICRCFQDPSSNLGDEGNAFAVGLFLGAASLRFVFNNS